MTSDDKTLQLPPSNSGENQIASQGSSDLPPRPQGTAGAWMFFIFPLGLFRIWDHPTWKQQTKWIASCCYVALMFVVVGVLESAGLIEESPSANPATHSANRATSPTTLIPEGVKIIAVAGAERDRKKWEAASHPNPLSFSDRKVSERIAVFQSIAKKLKESPDRLASEKQEEKFTSQLQQLIDEFRRIPFNGSYQTEDARTIIGIWEKKIENKFQGSQYLELKDEVANIFQQYRSRPE